MSCKWNEMTNLPNRDDREVKIYYCGPRAVENLLLLKKWFRWLSWLWSTAASQGSVALAVDGWWRGGCRNFHHQDWPSLRDNDRHHVVAPPSTAAAALTHIHTRSSLVARFSKETFVLCAVLLFCPCLLWHQAVACSAAAFRQLACWASTTLCAKGVIDSPHMVVLYCTSHSSACCHHHRRPVRQRCNDGGGCAAVVVARRVFDRGVFVRFPVGFCHRIQLRAIALAWSDYWKVFTLLFVHFC